MFLQNLWRKSKHKSNKIISFFVLVFILFYKGVLSVLSASGGTCRFYPSCSDYALLAYKNKGFFEASLLVLKRLWACRPFGSNICGESPFEEK